MYNRLVWEGMELVWDWDWWRGAGLRLVTWS